MRARLHQVDHNKHCKVTKTVRRSRSRFRVPTDRPAKVLRLSAFAVRSGGRPPPSPPSRAVRWCRFRCFVCTYRLPRLRASSYGSAGVSVRGPLPGSGGTDAVVACSVPLGTGINKRPRRRPNTEHRSAAARPVRTSTTATATVCECVCPSLAFRVPGVFHRHRARTHDTLIRRYLDVRAVSTDARRVRRRSDLGFRTSSPQRTIRHDRNIREYNTRFRRNDIYKTYVLYNMTGVPPRFFFNLF